MDNLKKVGISSHLVEAAYVNRTPLKKWKIFLWKRLWKMWKTLIYQQRNHLSPQVVENEKPAKKVGNFCKKPVKKRVMSLGTTGYFSEKKLRIFTYMTTL